MKLSLALIHGLGLWSFAAVGLNAAAVVVAADISVVEPLLDSFILYKKEILFVCVYECVCVPHMAFPFHGLLYTEIIKWSKNMTRHRQALSPVEWMNPKEKAIPAKSSVGF